MKNIKAYLLFITILFCYNTFAQTPEAFKKLEAFKKNEFASVLKDTNNTKYISTIVDTLKSLYKQCNTIYEIQSKDPGLKRYNVKVLGYKYMALSHLSKLATQSFYKDKKKEFAFLSSKYKDVQNDVAYAKKNSYLNWEDDMQKEVSRYSFNTIQIAYLLGDMKKQLPLALAIDSADVGVGRVERSYLAIFIIDGLIKNKNFEGLDKRIDTKVTGYFFKNEMNYSQDRTWILTEFATMLSKNKTSLIDIDKTGKMSNNFAKYMFEASLPKNGYDLFLEAANAGFDLPYTRIAVSAAALGCWRSELLDNATVIQNIDILKEANKKTPIGNAGWKVIVDTYTYLGDKTAAEEAKKNIK